MWKCPEQYRHWEWGHLLYLCHQEAASFQAHTTNIYATVFSPDGRWVSSHDAAGLAKVWDWDAEQVGLQLREFIEPGELDHVPTERRAVGGDPRHQRGVGLGDDELDVKPGRDAFHRVPDFWEHDRSGFRPSA